MDIYNVWCDLKPGIRDTQFAEKLNDYMAHLKSEGMIKGWRLTRRKLGLAPSVFGEFHLMIEIDGLHQLDRAFERVATRDEPTEGFHFGVNSLVCNAQFALYRDFPDAFRKRGEERF